jgi:hypothetical protein
MMMYAKNIVTHEKGSFIGAFFMVPPCRGISVCKIPYWFEKKKNAIS